MSKATWKRRKTAQPKRWIVATRPIKDRQMHVHVA